MQFSVIIPTFARPVSLRRCLDALKSLHFDFSQFEVIVVDDGSPMKLLAGYSPSPLQLTVLRQANGGPGAARNRGAAAARGQFLLFIDDDCLVVPDFLIHYQQAFERDPDALWGGSIRTAASLNCYCRAAQAVSDMVCRHYNREPDAARFFSSNNLGLARKQMAAIQGFEEVYFRIASEDREFCDRLRQAGFRLRRLEGAAIYHEPALNLVSYGRMFFRYGRGAYRYQRVRALRATGKLSQDLWIFTCAYRRICAG